MIKPKSIKQDFKNIQKSKQFLAIFILLFVSLLFWITVSLITSQTSTKISVELQQLAKPLNPVIDASVIDKIESKRVYSSDELSSFVIFKVLTSRDGRTENIVPIEVTIDDLEPKKSAAPSQATTSLLESEITKEEPEESLEPTASESAVQTSPSPESPSSSNLGTQL